MDPVEGDHVARPSQPGAQLLPRGVQTILRIGIVAWSIIGVALVAYGLWLVIAWLRVVVLALGLAALIVLVLEPAVSRLERRWLPRVAAVAIVYLAVLVPVGAGLWWLGGILAGQLRSLVERAPELVGSAGGAADTLWAWLDDVGVPVPAPTPEAWLTENREALIGWALSLATAATRLGAFLLVMVVGPVIAFYVLAELPRITRSALALLPADTRTRIVEGFRIVGSTVGAFFRGQLLIAALVGGLSTLGLVVLGVPYAVLVGTIAGATNLVPLFGPIVGGVPGVLLGWSAGGPWLALWVIVLFVAVQQLESHVLSPLILGATVRLRPVAVVIGMLAGAVVGGLLGMILAVPVIASVTALYRRFGPKPVADEAA